MADAYKRVAIQKFAAAPSIEGTESKYWEKFTVR
jgi:hypothetical protein